MKIFRITILFAILLLPLTNSSAQEVEVTVESLEASKEKIIKEEKDALKKEIEAINTRYENDEIEKEIADALKQEAAERHALNIENRIAIVENRIEYLKRNKPNVNIDFNKNNIVLEIFEDGDFVRINVNTKKKYDLRTTGNLVVAFGLNNLVTEGESFSDTEINIGGSRFFELGWAWKTRVFKESNWLRIKYGFSFSWDGLKPTDNRYYVDIGEETELQEFPHDLNKAKLRVDKLIFPVFFEFGPSKKIVHDDYFRYSTLRKFKFGIGGFAGFKLSSRQKLKYTENGDKQKDKIKASYNTNNVVYGINSYVGFGPTSLYVKYELNALFQDNPIDQHNISMGVRFDL